MAPETTPTKIPAETGLKGVADLLGGPRQFGGGIHDDPFALHDRLARGLPASALKHFASHCPHLAQDSALARILGMPPSTRDKALGRRTGRLGSHESGQLWRLAFVVVRATPLLGGTEAAERWLMRPAIGLGGRRPFDLLETPAGHELVADYLTQLEFGVYV